MDFIQTAASRIISTFRRTVAPSPVYGDRIAQSESASGRPLKWDSSRCERFGNPQCNSLEDLQESGESKLRIQPAASSGAAGCTLASINKSR